MSNCRVHGAVEGRIVYLVNSSEVFGYIRADKVYMEDGCSVEGGIVGREGVWIKEKVEIPGREEEGETDEIEHEQKEEKAEEQSDETQAEEQQEGSEAREVQADDVSAEEDKTEQVSEEAAKAEIAKEEGKDGVEEGEVQKDVS